MVYKNGHISDYPYKSEILKNEELLRLYKLTSRALFLNRDVIDRKTGEVFSLDDAHFFDMVYMNDSDWIEAGKITRAQYHRSKRLRDRIAFFMTQGDCIFLTLTFTDDVLNSTSDETRKKYVKRFLKSQSRNYVANIDFGSKREREHYHAIVQAAKVDYSLWHEYGGIKGQRIRTDGLSSVRLGKYISKLTNHAIKETTKRCAVIYSRLPFSPQGHIDEVDGPKRSEVTEPSHGRG